MNELIKEFMKLVEMIKAIWSICRSKSGQNENSNLKNNLEKLL